jgi:hypothetical protein
VVANHSGLSLNIEILHFKGCAGFVEALNILERIVAEEDLAIEVVPVISTGHLVPVATRLKRSSRVADSRA